MLPKKSSSTVIRDTVVKIFQLQDSKLIMNKIKKFLVVLTEYSIVTYNNLSKDFVSKFEKTKESYAD